MTPFARLTPSTNAAEIRFAREAGLQGRLLALHTAIADGRYRIDAEVIAAKLIARLGSRAEFAGNHH